MSKILMIFLVLALNFFNGFAQVKDIKFDRMTISHNGDSLIKQEYEFVIKREKVNFIAPFASYLHVKGEKYRTRVRFDKANRKEIFKQIDNLTWKNIERTSLQKNETRYYIIRTFKTDKLISHFKISEDSLPSDFKTLYEIVSTR